MSLLRQPSPHEPKQNAKLKWVSLKSVFLLAITSAKRVGHYMLWQGHSTCVNGQILLYGLDGYISEFCLRSLNFVKSVYWHCIVPWRKTCRTFLVLPCSNPMLLFRPSSTELILRPNIHLKQWIDRRCALLSMASMACKDAWHQATTVTCHSLKSIPSSWILFGCKYVWEVTRKYVLCEPARNWWEGSMERWLYEGNYWKYCNITSLHNFVEGIHG